MTEAKCLELLQMIADSADHPRKLTEAEYERYADNLRPYGWEKVYAALESIWKKATRVPRIADIEAEMGVVQLSAEKQIDLQAKLLGATIESCFGTFGYVNPDGARERIGEVGWAALGGTRGWIELCHLPSYDDLPIRLAQIREAAKALMLLSPEKRQGQFAPPERSAIDHTAARLAAAQKQLAEAKALLGIFTEAESDKQTGKLISFNRAIECE